MLNIRQWLISVVTSDPTLESMLHNTTPTATVPYNIYPLGIDIQPEAFPAITFQDAGVTLLSVPVGMHVGNFQVDIWSINNELETETIYTRLAQLVNYQHNRVATTPFPNGGTLWWIRETNVKDGIEGSARRMWRKTITYKFWTSNADES